MRKLMLSGNALTSLPLTMANLTKLELIRLACNNLTSPPMSVLRLPNLKWVALGSNPFTDKVAPPTVSKPKSIERSALEFGDVLGSGASGTTVEAVWNGKSVAVKQVRERERERERGTVVKKEWGGKMNGARNEIPRP